MILFLIVIGESFFYFYNNKFTNKIPVWKVKITEGPLQEKKTQQKKQNVFTSLSLPILRDTAISSDSFVTMSLWKKDFTPSAIIMVQFKGVVTSIDNEGTGSTPGFSYRKKITIKLPNGTEKTNLYFNDADLLTMKIYKSTNGAETPINFSDLKKGANIDIKTTLDLTKDENHNTIEMKIVETI